MTRTSVPLYRPDGVLTDAGFAIDEEQTHAACWLGVMPSTGPLSVGCDEQAPEGFAP